MAHHESLEDLNLENGLDDFYAGTSSGVVNLQPMPTSLGSPQDTTASTEGTFGKMDSDKGGDARSESVAGAAGAAAAAASAAAAALIGGKLSVSQVVEGVGTAVVPTSLAPVKEKAGKFLQKAQPWREFLLPLSLPTAAEGCSRMTANVYNFQTNYAILFVVQLLLTILLQPSALLSIVILAVVWVFFLKKNDDPDWHPEIGGVKLGPVQRWLALAAVTVIVLLFMAGSAISDAIFLFVALAFVHSVVHDPVAKGVPGAADNPPVEL